MGQVSETALDNISLLLRRIVIVLVLFLILYLILFKWIGLGKKATNISTTSNEVVVEGNNGSTNKDTNIAVITTGKVSESSGIVGGELTKLGSDYSTDGTNIYYKGEKLGFVDSKDFTVLDKKQKKSISGKLINSDNLLSIFKDYDARVAMMNTIDDIIINEKNVTDVLKTSSENGMYKIKSDYENLSQYNRQNQKGVLTPEQRAKFAVIYLYVKIAKNAKGTVYMEQALAELKSFLENFDSNNLKPEITDQNFKLKGNVGMDKNCIFVDGKLYTCFLDNLF